MEGRVALIAPLVGEVDRFLREHEAGHRVAAAEGLLAYLRADRTEAAALELPVPREGAADPERIALELLVALGELAKILIDAPDPEAKVAWARSSLIVDVECYRAAIG